MSLVYTIKCRDCTNLIEIENGKGTANRIYCESCRVIKRKIASNRKYVVMRAKRVYPSMLINLTKNYILFMEGVRK